MDELTLRVVIFLPHCSALMMTRVSTEAAALAAKSPPAVPTPTPQEKKRKPEWVLTLFSGESSTKASSLVLDQPGRGTKLRYDSVRWDDRSFAFPPYYGNRVAYFPSNEATVGFAWEFIHYKVFADTSRTTRVSGTLKGDPYNEVEPIENTLQEFYIANGVNCFTVSVIGRSRSQKTEAFPTGRVQTYLGLGYGIVIPHPVSRISGESSQGYEFDGWTWQAFAGIEYRFSPDWGLYLEYKYNDFNASVAAAGGGELRTRLKSDHIVFGTSYRIG